jgi:hypothetical protein
MWMTQCSSSEICISSVLTKVSVVIIAKDKKITKEWENREMSSVVTSMVHILLTLAL